jgi:3-methyl-2-oxobutanoate hydroxymethyltransferase
VKSRKTILDIAGMKSSGEKISVLTAYDYPFAQLMDQAGIDVILVGDSVGSVFSGYENTLPVTLDEMIYHTRPVVRASKQALVVADMPFMSYQIDLADARRNAGRLIKEAGAQAVKLEGGQNMAATIAAITAIDIPVMAHIGLTPQSIHRMGGFKVQGRQGAQAEQILADAKAVEAAGAFAVVLEGIPAGLGLCDKYSPKFVKRFADVRQIISDGIGAYISEVKSGSFPGVEHSFK